MLKKDSLRTTTSLRVLCEAAEELGVPKTDCLAGTGLEPDDLYKDDLEVTLGQEVLAIENYANITGKNVGLGSAIAERMHMNAFGIWGFAILTSPTVREAIHTAIDFSRISYLITEMSLLDDPDESGTRYDTTAMSPAVRSFVIERHAGVTMKFIREALQEPEFNAFVIHTSLPQAQYGEALREMMGVEIVGDAEYDALLFDHELLDRPLPKSDPVTLRFCLDQCRVLLESRKENDPPWTRKVHDAVIDDIGTEQKIENIAQRLSITERTLRRRLNEENTSFREIYTEARLMIAHELLETAGLTVETVSWRVGYSEPASFVRAFAKRFDRTPGEVRR